MNPEKLFDMLVHRNENPKAPFKTSNSKGAEVIVRPEQMDFVVARTIQSFMHKTGSLGFDKFGKPVPFETRRPIQAFSGSSDLPQLTKDVFDVTAKTPNFDTAWQEAFKGMTLRRGQLDWEIADVSTGGGFELIPEGGKVKIESVAGNKITVGVNKYGYGLGITWETIEGRKLYAFVDAMEQARAKMMKIWADVHYGLIDVAAATNTTAWQGVATDPILSRDIATINAGAYAIANATKDSGYGDTANAPMILYINPKYRARMEAALQAVRGDIVSGRTAGAAGSVDGQQVDWNVEVRYTFNGNVTADKGVLVLPGNKIQNAVYLRELGLSRQELESLSELRTYWTAFGAAVGDNDQAAQLSFT